MKPLPTLRQLRYLVAVAKHRHFGRAAADCLVTQSTLSAGIRELETLLGVTLIGRSRRRVTLTPLGEDIGVRARALLRAAEELVDAAQAGGQPLSGLLRLGVIPTIAPYLLPRALPKVRDAFPNLRLYLREEQTARALELLSRARLDAALIALPYDLRGLQSMILGEDRLLVACPAGHRFAKQARVSPDELKGERLLLLEDGHCLRDHALTACRLHSSRANEEFQATSMGTLVQMVASGLGITLLPKMAVEVEANREPGVAVVPLAGNSSARRIALCWLSGSARATEFATLGAALEPYLLSPEPTAQATEQAPSTGSIRQTPATSADIGSPTSAQQSTPLSV